MTYANLPHPSEDAPYAEADRQAMDRLKTTRRKRNRLGRLGLILTIGMALFVTIGPWIIPFDPNQQNLPASTLPIWSTFEGQLHVLGTDPLGQDVLARLAAGGRASLAVVLASLLIGGGLGITLGLLSGYFGGISDSIIMRVIDVQLGLPTVVFAMLVASVLGLGFRNTVLAIGFASWPIYARVVRAELLSLREREFVRAATVIGVGTMRMFRVHILPNIAGSLAVIATLELGRMILVESTLSFVGLGMQPPDASWGAMINQGQEYIYTAWWLPTLPGLMIALTVLGMNLLGDWLRDLLDPRMR